MPVLPRKGKHVGGGGGAARGVALLELARHPLALALDLSCVQRAAAAAAVGVVYYRGGGLLSLSPFLPSLSAMRLEIENETNRRRSDKGTME